VQILAALTKDLAEVTDFTQSKAAEVQRLTGVDTLAGNAPPTHVLPGAATVVCENGRAHFFEDQNYKTKNKN
jgi:hypothetical protein